MKIKALVVWDPWAWLIRLGLKKHETRGWGTSYRGPLLICAAKRRLDRDMLAYINGILCRHGQEPICAGELCPGHAVAVVDLVKDIHCVWFGSGLITPPNLSPLDQELGDFSSGRHALKLENLRAIEPFPIRGYQGLFDVEVEERIL